MELEASLPIRSLNQFDFCPRLFWFMYASGLMEANQYVVEGQAKHGRINDPKLAGRERQEAGRLRTRSVDVASQRLGIHGKLDVLEEEAGVQYPVEYKRGYPPRSDDSDDPQVWPNDAVQVCAQALALEETLNIHVEQGYIVYLNARFRIPVKINPVLRQQTLEVIERARRVRQEEKPPVPLPPDERSKCRGCSLLEICLPEETIVWEKAARSPESEAPEVSPRVIPHDPAGASLYLLEPGTRVRLESQHLVIQPREGESRKIPLVSLEKVVCGPAVNLTTAVIQELAEADIPLTHVDNVGRVVAVSFPPHSPNVHVRRAQFRQAENPEFRLTVAREFVASKVRNQRTLLMRSLRTRTGSTASEDPSVVHLRALIANVERAVSIEELLGIEGAAAAAYFERFPDMLTAKALARGFNWEGRNRRPPRDPVNALLSFAYGMLAKDCAAVAHMVGLEVGCGFYHTHKWGRPALALDLMEEFRPLLADSAVLTAINNGEIKERDFISWEGGCMLTPDGRRRFIEVYQRRRNQEVTHPLFRYRISMMRAIEAQARQLSKVLIGELPRYQGFVLR